MKKLLIISDSFLPRIDGVARFLADIAAELKKHFSLKIIAPDYNGKNSGIGGAEIIRVPVHNIQIGDYRPPKRDRRLVHDEIDKCDIVWTQTLGPLGSSGISYASMKKKRLIAFTHSMEWELFSKGAAKSGILRNPIERITKVFARKRYNMCSHLIVPSLYARDELKKLGVRTRMTVVRLGVDSKKFVPPKDKRLAKKDVGLPGQKIIGYIGRIGKEKDIFTLVHAYKKLKQSAVLLIVGGGNRHIESKIKGAGIIKIGTVEDPLEYYQAMDIFVLPSLTETTSLSTMEAMACQVPPVCTPVGLIQEYIKDGKNGFMFPRGDERALAAILEHLLSDEELRKRTGRAARETIRKKYIWKSSVEKIINVLKP